MKIKLLAFVVLVVAFAASSCYSSRKNGCPMNQQATYKFRG